MTDQIRQITNEDRGINSQLVSRLMRTSCLDTSVTSRVNEVMNLRTSSYSNQATRRYLALSETRKRRNFPDHSCV